MNLSSLQTVQLRPRLLLATAEAGLVLLLAVQTARLVWTVAEPGTTVAARILAAPAADFSILTAFDPFFRPGEAAAVASAGQTFRLFGVRADAGGRGSAIIAGPDGRQASVGVGEEVAPGVTLRAVASDHVVLSRGGVETRLHFPDPEIAQ